MDVQEMLHQATIVTKLDRIIATLDLIACLLSQGGPESCERIADAKLMGSYGAMVVDVLREMEVLDNSPSSDGVPATLYLKELGMTDDNVLEFEMLLEERTEFCLPDFTPETSIQDVVDCLVDLHKNPPVHIRC